MEFPIIGICALWALSIWYLRCNALAARQLEDMATLIAEQDDIVRLFRLYWKVSYDKHVWALFFFRDPWKLYSKEIQDIMRGGEMNGLTWAQAVRASVRQDQNYMMEYLARRGKGKMTDFKVGDKVLLPMKHPRQSIESRICEVVGFSRDLSYAHLNQGGHTITYLKEYLVKYEGKDNANSSK